jgi:lysozyme
MTVTGVDVCAQDGALNWTALAAADIGFAYIKASEGLTHRDVRFADNWGRAGVANLLRGGYHYARPDLGSTGTDEASEFAEALDTVDAANPGRLPPAVVVASTVPAGGPGTAAWISAFVDKLVEQTGRRPLLYLGRTYKTQLGDHPSNYECPLWLAQYGGTPSPPSAWRTWTFWQYAASGTPTTLPDVPLHLDRFAGNRAELQALTVPASTGAETRVVAG